MKMKSTLVFVPLMMTIMITTVQGTATTPKPTTTTPKPTTTTPKPTTTTPKPATTTRQPTTPWTTGRPAANLNGVMATLSGERISFYPPYYSPDTSSPYYISRPYYTTRRPYYTTRRPYTTTTTRSYTTTRPYYTTRRPYYTTRRPYYTTRRPYTTTPYTTTRSYTTTRPYYTTTTAPWTTPPLNRGVSICLRYLTDSNLYLTLSPQGRDTVTLSGGNGWYQLTYGRWRNTLMLTPSIKILPDVAPEIWTRVCFTMDFMKKVAQMFRDSNMSIRKRLLVWYSWQGEPVIQFSDFAGQVTDVQMWDYPLNYREVTEYMNGGVYRLYRGSLLTWSYISYLNSGNMLLEDVYEVQAKLPIKGRGRRLRGGKKSSGWGFNMRESKRQQL